ncbi:MAG: polysaccharide deacetylase family protein [Desulfosudaceae bacterium]
MSQKFLAGVVGAVFLLVLTGWPAATRVAAEENEVGQGQIRALMYHHFGLEDKYPSTSVSRDQFEKHLDYLKKHDHTVLTLGQALDLLSSDKPLPEKTTVITIDDGYDSIWEIALPLLEKYGYTATVFVSTKLVGGGSYLDWEQIQALQDKGFEIGNHSHSHAYFLNRPAGERAEAFEEDLLISHEKFRRHLGGLPELYAYPFGEYDPAIMAVLKEHGYKAAAAQRSGVIYEGSERFALPRFPMNLNYGEMEGFAEKMEMNALGVVEAVPESPVVGHQNPPTLMLRIDNSELNPEGLQCFVAGQENCHLEKSSRNGLISVQARAKKELTSRRTLYTVTAPSKDGSKWFWYSYLWVIPAESSPEYFPEEDS